MVNIILSAFECNKCGEFSVCVFNANTSLRSIVRRRGHVRLPPRNLLHTDSNNILTRRVVHISLWSILYRAGKCVYICMAFARVNDCEQTQTLMTLRKVCDGGTQDADQRQNSFGPRNYTYILYVICILYLYKTT